MESIEMMVDGRAYRGVFRLLDDRVEVEWEGARHDLPLGTGRPAVVAANCLRIMVRQADQP